MCEVAELPLRLEQPRLPFQVGGVGRRQPRDDLVVQPEFLQASASWLSFSLISPTRWWARAIDPPVELLVLLGPADLRPQLGHRTGRRLEDSGSPGRAAPAAPAWIVGTCTSTCPPAIRSSRAGPSTTLAVLLDGRSPRLGRLPPGLVLFLGAFWSFSASSAALALGRVVGRDQVAVLAFSARRSCRAMPDRRPPSPRMRPNTTSHGHQQQRDRAATASVAQAPSPEPLRAGDRPRHDRLARRKRRRSSAIAATSGYRRAGSFCRHFRQIVSRSRGILGRSCEGGTGSLVADQVEGVEDRDPPERRPAGEQLVEGGAQGVLVGGGPDLLVAAWPARGPCSSASRGSSRCGSGPSRPPSRLTRPKSAIFGVPSAASRTLAGLMSRWTMPRRCATSMARARASAIRAASSTGWGLPPIRCDEAAAGRGTRARSRAGRRARRSRRS